MEENILISLEIFQNCLAFIPKYHVYVKYTLNILLPPLGLNCGNLLECQKKVLKI